MTSIHEAIALAKQEVKAGNLISYTICKHSNGVAFIEAESDQGTSLFYHPALHDSSYNAEYAEVQGW